MQRDLDLGEGWHAGPLFVAAKRRAPKLRIRSSLRWRFTARRTPPWADRNLLRALLQLKMIWSKAMGVQYTLDHVVPLNHPLVCGLHCPANLEVLLEEDNLRKSNNWWPDMPEVQLEIPWQGT